MKAGQQYKLNRGETSRQRMALRGRESVAMDMADWEFNHAPFVNSICTHQREVLRDATWAATR